MSADALVTLKELADALGGEVVGDRVLCPGPNHSGADRSLSVWPANNAAGFTVHSFAGDTRQECIAHVKAMLDSERRAALAKLGAALLAREARAEDPRKLANKKRALEIWAEAEGPIGTLAERYLWGERSLDLARELAGDVLRFHKACPWTDEATDKTIYVPAMLAAMRDILTDKVVAIHRTRLSPVGQKLGRKMLGPAAGAAVKIDEDANVTIGLTIGEGIESCLAARALGFAPVWALGNTIGIKNFPVLGGVDALTIMVENDENKASEKAAAACFARWHEAGREVLYARSLWGNDANDAYRRRLRA